MPPVGYARLQSAAHQLAASFENVFPTVVQTVTWEFTVDVGWEDHAADEPFCYPLDRWGAFLHPAWREDRYLFLELLPEEVGGLSYIVRAMRRCQYEIRRALRESHRMTREVLLYADLLRQLRRTRWTTDGGFELERTPSWEDRGYTTGRVLVFRPNVGLAREMARLIGGDVQQPEAATPDEMFVPSAVQKAILTALAGRAMRTDELARTTKVERSQMFRHMKELKARRLVLLHKKIGFYRPDVPPAILVKSTEVNRRATK